MGFDNLKIQHKSAVATFVSSMVFPGVAEVIALQWTTANEINVAGRSYNGLLGISQSATGSYLYVKPPTGNTNVQISVVDMSRKTWYNAKLAAGNMSNGRFKIPITKLLAGSYILRISDKNGERLQVKSLP